MLTLNQIRYYFTQFFENHYQIHTVIYADDFDFSAKPDVLYKVAHVQPVDPASVNDSEIVYKFKIAIGDIEDPNNQDSENDIWSDCVSIANDFISFFGNDDFSDFYVDKNIQIQRFSESNTDRVAGVVFAFGVRQTRLNNPCTIPLINPLAGVSYTGEIPLSNVYYNLLEPYITFSSASTLFQTKGNYLTGATVDLSNFYTKSQSDSRFLTGFSIDLSGYQSKGNYVSATTLSGYQIAGNYVSASTLNQYQLAGNYVSALTLALYQLAGNYLTGVTSNQVVTALGYTPISGYSLTATTISGYNISDAYTKNQSDSKFLTGYTMTATTLAGLNISSGDTLFDNKYLSITSAATFNNYYNKTQSDGKYLTGYTLTATTLSGYGITNAAPLGYDPNMVTMQSFGSQVKGYTLGGPILTNAAAYTLLTGTTVFAAVSIPLATTISGLKFFVQTAGIYNSNGYNGVALYSVSGSSLSLVASSATNNSLWKTFGLNSVSFTTPVVANAGGYYAALIYNNSGATTDPKIYAVVTSIGLNIYDFTNGNKTAAFLTQSNLPATVTASVMATASSAPFFLLY